jgi:hypothetical protein
MSESLFPASVWGLPDNSNAFDDGDWSNLLAGMAFQNSTQPQPPQQTAGSMPELKMGRRIFNQSPAAVYGSGAAAAPAPSVDANYSGGLLGRLAALAGIDSQNPNQLAVPADDEDQADIGALDAMLSSSGKIGDAMALYNARRSGRR